MPAAPAGQHDVPLLVAGQVRVCTRGATARKRVSDQRVRISSLGGGVLSRLSVAKRMRVRVFQEVRGPPPQRRLPAAGNHLPHAACCLPAGCRLPSSGCRLAPGTARLTLPRAWAQGDVLQAEGEPCEHMFCVADGEVRRFRKEGQSTVEVRRIADPTLSRTYQHVPMQMDTLGREDTTSTFGILHLARNEPYFATARAMTGGKVYTLSSADFNDLIGAPLQQPPLVGGTDASLLVLQPTRPSRRSRCTA